MTESPSSPATWGAGQPLSGEDHVIRAGGYEAHIASVGATLRTLQKDGVDLVAPFPADRLRPGMSGALLAPWPNRTAGGRYEFGGIIHELPINEPGLGNAAHGLVAWQHFAVLHQVAGALALRSTIPPQPGYPWRIVVEVVFTLSADGLAQEVTVWNASATPAPFGVGGHPYLVASPPAIDAVNSWVLELDAEVVMLVDGERLLPVGSVHVADTPMLDFRRPTIIGEARINHAYTSLRRGAEGLARARLRNHAGQGVEIAWDERCPWVQVYTSDASPDAPRSAVAIEPMTCPPDALNSKRDLAVIPPGGRFTAGWSIRDLPSPATTYRQSPARATGLMAASTREQSTRLRK